LLEQQYAAASAAASAAVGAQAWTELAQAGPLLLQLDTEREELAACIKTHSAALTASVVVIDASGSQAPSTQTATLWDLTSTGPVTVETVPIQAGAFGFAGPVPASAAVSLAPDSAGDPSLIGVDFRSGPLPQPLAVTPRVEIVIAPKLTVSAQKLRGWASTFQSTPQDIGAGGFLGRLQAVVTAPTITFTTGAVRVDLTGTVTRASGGAGAFLNLPSSMPFAAGIALSLAPGTDPYGRELVAVTLAGQNPIVLNLPGTQVIVDTILPLVTPFVGEQIRTSLSASINQLVPAAIERGLALASLPPATQLSLRSVAISEAGITIQPVLGAFGTLLSTFQPTTLPNP
jgi:hypothetical protein